MKKCPIKIVILAITLVLLNSCATILNSKNKDIRVVTSEATHMVIEEDSLAQNTKFKYISVKRSPEPLSITVYNDSISKTVQVKAKNSLAYWLNLYPSIHLWTGFIIDTKTQKRYSYPNEVYIDLLANDNTYQTYRPIDSSVAKYNKVIKFTPLKLLGLINPSIELVYERRTSPSFSTQIMASYLLPRSVTTPGFDFYPDIKGFRVSIEEKYYIYPTAISGLYFGLEFNYLNNTYRDLSYFSDEPDWLSSYNDTNMYLDNYGIKKQTFSLNAKVGYQYSYDRFVIDLFAGLGIRYRDVSHFDRTNPNDYMEMPRHPNIEYSSNKEGQNWTISIPLNVRLGWIF